MKVVFSEFADYYKSVAISCDFFDDTLSNIKLHEKDDAEQIFGKVSLNVIKNHSESISVLLNNNLYIEPICLVRNIFEIFVKNYWIYRGKDAVDKFERICKLEATPYHNNEKEVGLMIEDLKTESPVWSKDKVDSFTEMLNTVKRDNPHLIRESDGKFKKAIDICSMINDTKLRLKYYHIYRFASIFSHPTPMLKDLYLKASDDKRTEVEIIEDPLKNTLSYGLLFIEFIIEQLMEIFKDINPDGIEARIAIHKNISNIVKKSNNDYFEINAKN